MSENVVNRPVAVLTDRFQKTVETAPFAMAYVASGIILVILFSAAGAYDTDEISFGHRLAMWSTIIALMIAQTVGAFRTLPGENWVRVLSTLGAVTIATALEIHALKFTPLVPHAPDPIIPFIAFVAPAVLPLSLGVIAAEVLREQKSQKVALADSKSGTRIGSLSGLRPETEVAHFSAWPHAPISSVKSADHYLEVTIESGETLFVRGRMKDAIRRLAEADGMQVHRSWWVAREAVAEIKARGRDKFLILRDGREIPVGRSRIAPLKDAGWI
ncbi:MAG: LytTR family DNA-binding domain-containing protein [Pseudomonadota bacterium]